MRGKHVLGMWCGLVLLTAASAGAEEIGKVSTTFKFVGANDKIVIEAFDDPDISGATCYVSRAKTGGVKGSIRRGRGYLGRLDLLPSDRADNPAGTGGFG